MFISLLPGLLIKERNQKMKYILHVGIYDFEMKDADTAARVAEILMANFVPDSYHDKLDVSVEFKKEDE